MKFRKKPVVIEALRFDGSAESCYEIARWAHEGLAPESNSIILRDGDSLRIRTLEGLMTSTAGDWIIKGVAGEFYPCKNDVFALTYEAVEG